MNKRLINDIFRSAGFETKVIKQGVLVSLTNHVVNTMQADRVLDRAGLELDLKRIGNATLVVVK